MKTFTKSAAQGDVLFTKVNEIPEGLIEQKSNNGELVITHSETGHNHVMMLDREETPAVQMFNDKGNPLLSWLLVNRPTSLDHKRVNHTHESIMFEKGAYRINRQREQTPEGWRKAID